MTTSPIDTIERVEQLTEELLGCLPQLAGNPQCMDTLHQMYYALLELRASLVSYQVPRAPTALNQSEHRFGGES